MDGEFTGLKKIIAIKKKSFGIMGEVLIITAMKSPFIPKTTWGFVYF
jgi:hypothetical protein